ncbi:MAG: hypothetical protein E7451_05505 [Ruminococcaceae bacterium]|nr:hypothetical protein [Oscillospiraceae bacterium]
MKNEHNVDIYAVRNKMVWMGFRDNIAGTPMLREAIKMWEPGMSVTKEIYPAVAKLFGSTASRVERNMRHAIESAWDRGDYYSIESVFGGSISEEKGKPTNGEFIARMAVYFGVED